MDGHATTHPHLIDAPRGAAGGTDQRWGTPIRYHPDHLTRRGPGLTTTSKENKTNQRQQGESARQPHENTGRRDEDRPHLGLPHLDLPVCIASTMW